MRLKVSLEAMPLAQIFDVQDLIAVILDFDHRAWLVAPPAVRGNFELWYIAFGTKVVQLPRSEFE